MKYKFKPSHVVPAFLFVVAVLYGGSKPSMPTNTPPDDASSPTNAPMMMCAGPLRGRGLSQTSQVGQTNAASGGLGKTATPVMFEVISNWTARGAYCDWKPITFSDGFRFPVGTNFIDGVTLFAWGELRTYPLTTNNQQLATLPLLVSLEPNVSSITHGLTPSNSYLFAWHNCCAERSATNRVNASIELFPSGEVVTTFNGAVGRVAPRPPEDWIGIGQDEDWIRATFPDEADAILMEGYDSWLLNTWTGINAENGHCLVRVTVAALPDDGSPCYLSCGSFRVNVTQPGTYGFPIEVLTDYEVRTYPTPVPLTFEYDDGYRGEGGPSFEVVEDGSRSRTAESSNSNVRPRLMLAAPALNQQPTTNNQQPTCIYRFFMRPKVVVTPNRVSLDEAEGKVLDLWVNVTNTIERSWSCFSYNTRLSFTRNQAVIDAARVAELTEILLEQDRRIARGELEITPLPIDESQVETNRIDVTIFEGETWHTAETNDLYVKYFTVPTEAGSTNEVLDTNVYGPPAGRSVYIGVFMASAEDMGNIEDCCDDRISWNVQVNGASVLSGETSVYAHHDALHAVALEARRLYGIGWPAVLLGGCQVDPPNGDDYGIRLIGTAQNVGDGLRQTCLQIGIFPIDDNGAVVGCPSWAQR